MQAVIKVGSTQFIVEPGQTIEIDHLTSPKDTLVYDQVMLLVDGSSVQVGKPFLTGVSVKATYVSETRGEKIRVAKFKAKSRYRKAVGFKAKYSLIKIDSITTGSSSVVSEVKTPEKAPAKAPAKARQKKTV